MELGTAAGAADSGKTTRPKARASITRRSEMTTWGPSAPGEPTTYDEQCSIGASNSGNPRMAGSDCSAYLAEAQSPGRGLPSFFLIGPPRTGTTWLYSLLSKYTRLPYPTKETRFFDQYYERGMEWYASHYRKADSDRKIGEVAPTYFASSKACQRIAQLIPGAKVVCTFRNPVDRVWSLYRLKRAYGMIPWNFEEALVRDRELFESSRYVFHLREWINALGADQVMVTVHDDIQADPQSYLDNLVDFIGVPRVKLLPAHKPRLLASANMTQPRNYYWTRGATLLSQWAKKRRLDSLVSAAKKWGAMNLFVGGGSAFVEMSSSQRTCLRKLFRPEIELLEEMLNRDLSNWK